MTSWIWENVHSSHIRFYSFGGQHNNIIFYTIKDLFQHNYYGRRDVAKFICLQTKLNMSI